MASWKCSACGYTLEEDELPPLTCPSCRKTCAFVYNTCYTPDCEGEGVDKRI
jgi:rubredoxin